MVLPKRLMFKLGKNKKYAFLVIFQNFIFKIFLYFSNKSLVSITQASSNIEK